MVLKEHIKLQLNNCSRLSLEKKVTKVKRNLVTVVIVLQISQPIQKVISKVYILRPKSAYEGWSSLSRLYRQMIFQTGWWTIASILTHHPDQHFGLNWSIFTPTIQMLLLSNQKRNVFDKMLLISWKINLSMLLRCFDLYPRSVSEFKIPTRLLWADTPPRFIENCLLFCFDGFDDFCSRQNSTLNSLKSIWNYACNWSHSK